MSENAEEAAASPTCQKKTDLMGKIQGLYSQYMSSIFSTATDFLYSFRHHITALALQTTGVKWEL